MKKIESYNASYPAAFYEIGTIYSFYGKKSSKGTSASRAYIDNYSAVLKDLEEDQKKVNAIQPVKGSSANISGGKKGLNRYYAVVVSKSATFIEIMFLNGKIGSESYLTRKYAVSKSKSCDTDGKDLMAPTIRIKVSRVQGDAAKIGGVTRLQSESNSKVGGITRTGQNSAMSPSVGGITRMKDQHSDDDSSFEVPNRNESKVGGITRIKK